MQQRPHVVLNLAMTADGKIDTVERRGASISGPSDTARVDRLRAQADAVMVGGRTLLREDPRLTVRDASLSEKRVLEGRSAQPAKVGIASSIGLPDSDNGLPRDSRFLRDGGGRVVVYTTEKTAPAAIEWLEQQGAETVVSGDERVDLGQALAQLRDSGVARLMVEGGGTLVATLLEAGLVDEMQLAIAPVLFGGETAPTPVDGPGWPGEHTIPLSLEETSTDSDGHVILRYLVGMARRNVDTDRP